MTRRSGERWSLSLRLDEKQPLIIDFRGEQEQVTSVTLNGGDIPYEVKDEHIVIASDWVAVERTG